MERIFGNVEDLASSLPAGKRFTLVGGAFDLIHDGHLHLLEFAGSLEEVLVVAVLSDEFIRGYKSADRPIHAQGSRVKMVAGMRCVDYVYISATSPNGVDTLNLLKPNSVVFGQEEENKDNVIRWTERIKMYSPETKIHLLPRYMDGEVSTSHIIAKIRGLAG